MTGTWSFLNAEGIFFVNKVLSYTPCTSLPQVLFVFHVCFIGQNT